MVRQDIPRHDYAARFSTLRVVVVGDIMLDTYLHGEVSRISPEAPVPVLELRETKNRPGGAANVAANVASLGGNVLLLGVVGQDAAGQTVRDELDALRVGTRRVVTAPGRPTTSKARIVARGQQVVRLDSECCTPICGPIEDSLCGAVAEASIGADIFVISDYAKGVVTDRVCRVTIQSARAAGKTTIVDPKGSDYSKYRGADLLTPNVHELELIAGPLRSEKAIAAAARALSLELGASILVTRGADGMLLVKGDEAPVTLPTAAQTVYDVVGAGDTVVAACALALASGAPLVAALDMANRAAGIAVAKQGTTTVSLEELVSARASSISVARGPFGAE